MSNMQSPVSGGGDSLKEVISETSDADNDARKSVNDTSFGGTKTSPPAVDDVAPVFILQPKEIIKNIDLMKTVAILMENKLHATTIIKRLDEEKMKDLCGDIERFPEAFHKFISIIHQIQYLNVTSDWNFSINGESIPVVAAGNRGGVMSRLFGLEKSQPPPELAEYDARKHVLLYLLNTLQQVLHRYLKLQQTLEERLKKYYELLLTVEQAGKLINKQYNRCSIPTDSEDDDPNLPLLMPSQRRSLLKTSGKVWLEKVESLQRTLRRTKRSGAEVQDSLEVLRELVLWDYKQVVSTVTPAWSEDNLNHCSSGRRDSGTTANETSYTTLEGLQCSQTQQMSHEMQNSIGGHQSKRMWKLCALLAGLLVILVAVTALSFLKFRY